MGMLINGDWSPDTDRFLKDGAFVRESSGFDHDPSFHLSDSGLPPAGRYLLIASLSCPWSHRVLMARALLGLQSCLPLCLAVEPRVEGYGLADCRLLEDGSGISPKHLHQLYSRSDPGHTGRATVPLIWDRLEGQISSNSSASIMRGLEIACGKSGIQLAPDHLTTAIDRMNAHIFEKLANAVYRAGLARRQSAYDAAVADVFATLDWLEAHLANNRYLLGSLISEADLCLFPTLVRFDAVYATHFRCTRRRLVDYPALWAYAREVFTWPGVAETVDLKAIQEGYFLNDGDHNPHGIISLLPDVDWTEPHDREKLGQAEIWTHGGRPVAIDPAHGLTPDAE